MAKLGVNIDHVATVRQARQTTEPDPVAAAVLAELGGADGITVHLREDRRHIQDRDVLLLRRTVTTKLNLEMGLAEEIVKIALGTAPDQVTIVPEKREEITTEGGLDVIANEAKLREAIPQFHDQGIEVSLFIDPDKKQIEASRDVGADAVELHTGRYAEADTPQEVQAERYQLELSATLAANYRLVVHAGHGLTYRNVRPIATIDTFEELNIGHSIVSRSVMVGMERAVREMKALLMV
jgi:pyridoxine 5-phosphate synthase